MVLINISNLTQLIQVKLKNTKKLLSLYDSFILSMIKVSKSDYQEELRLHFLIAIIEKRQIIYVLNLGVIHYHC